MVVSEHAAPPAGRGDEHAGLGWDSLAPAALVHLRTVSQVLITGMQRHTTNEYGATLQWPRRHPLNRWDTPAEAPFSPLLVAESGRQLGIALTQLHADPPGGAHYLIDTIATRTNTNHLGRRPASAAWDLTAQVSLDLEPTRGPLRGFTLDAALSHDGVEFARCTGHASVVSDAAYRRLRGPRLGARQAAAAPTAWSRPTADEVGVRDTCDVLLARTPEGRLHLHVEDDGHPVWFDHPSDHVPGMVLLEAARQCSRLLGSTTARPDTVPGLTLRTARFCEWDGAVLLRHEPRPHGARVTFDQDGDTVAEVDLDLP
jgi:hypothetical protein